MKRDKKDLQNRSSHRGAAQTVKTVKRDKEGHYIMIKGSIQEVDITTVSICVSNTGAPKYIKQILTDVKGETDSNTIKMRNFKTPLISRDRSENQ